MKINGNITLNPLGQSEIQNLVVERVSAIPAHNSADKGRFVYNLVDNKFYLNDGTTWVSIATGGNAASLSAELDTLQATLGAFVNADGTVNSLALNALINVDGATTLMAALTQLDAAISGKDQLSELLDVDVTGALNTSFLKYDGTKWVDHVPVLANISDVTATAAQVNFLVGVTSSVQGQLNTESAARVAADDTLTTNLAAEATTRSNADGAIQAELDVTQVGAGLSAAGTFVAHTTSNYMNASTSLRASDVILDGQIKTVSDSHAAFVSAQATRDTNQDVAIGARLPTAGGTMTGAIVMSTGTRITINDLPLLGTDATNKTYVDSAVSGLTWKTPVDTVAATLAVFAAQPAGYRFLALDTDLIHTSTGSAWDAGVLPADGWSVFDRATEAGYVFSGTVWVQFTGAGQIVDGIGLVKIGNVIDVNMGAGIVALPSDEVGIDVLSAGGLFTTINGTVPSAVTAAQLAVKLDGTTLSVGVDGLRVGAATITAITQNTADIATEITNRQSADTAIQNELNTTQAGAGLEVTGAYAVNSGANYISGVGITSLKLADNALDAALKAEEVARIAADATNATATSNEATARAAADTAINARIAAGYFLYTGGTAATVHIVNHGIGTKYCNVTIIDGVGDEQVIPQSVVFNSATQLTVTFNAAIACKVVVMGLSA